MNIVKTLSYFALFLFTVVTTHGCEEHKNKKEITRIVTEWYGKEINIPGDMVFTQYGVDTIQYDTVLLTS